MHLACTTLVIMLVFIIPAFPPPPGTKKVSDNLFVDKNPIRYIDYYEFLFYLQQQEPAVLPQMLPVDTTCTYGPDTLWHNTQYDEFPILGLNTEQMQRYCAWRSDRVNQLIMEPHLRCTNFKFWHRFDVLDPDKKYRVVYSLPSTADLSRARVKTNPYSLHEYTLDGVWKGKAGQSSLVVFRCKAEYIEL
jgi:hypothetical protein